MLGQHAVAFKHIFRTLVDDGVALVRAVHPEVDFGRDELGDVTVHAHEAGVDTLLRGLDGERAHEVVRLVALQLVDGDAERLDHLAGALHLAGELLALLVGHGDTRGFVSVGDLVAEGRSCGVERDDDMRRLELAEHMEERIREAEGRADQLAGGAELEGLLHHLHGVEGAVDDRVAVDQDETALCGGAHGGIITLGGSRQLLAINIGHQSCP